jgi:hypothetical protein
MMEGVLRDAFLKTDEEFSDSGLQAGLVGSTAVVALVGTHRVWIANCGECMRWVQDISVGMQRGLSVRAAAAQVLYGCVRPAGCD